MQQVSEPLHTPADYTIRTGEKERREDERKRENARVYVCEIEKERRARRKECVRDMCNLSAI